MEFWRIYARQNRPAGCETAKKIYFNSKKRVHKCKIESVSIKKNNVLLPIQNF